MSDNTYEGLNDWGGRAYDDFVAGEVTKIKRWRQAANGDLLEGDVRVNDSITVSSA